MLLKKIIIIPQALVTCLESKDYIQIRNAILVLQGIHSCFPAIVNLANVIDKRIEKVGSYVIYIHKMEWTFYDGSTFFYTGAYGEGNEYHQSWTH